MNRRNFIKGIGSLGLLSLLPKLPKLNTAKSNLNPDLPGFPGLRWFPTRSEGVANKCYSRVFYGSFEDGTWDRSCMITFLNSGGKLYPYIGLIDKNNLPCRTKLKEWIICEDDYMLRYDVDRMNDLEQWYCRLNDPRANNTTGYYIYHGWPHSNKNIKFCYRGSHPIYKRLFPIPA